ncbi:MAG: TIR domain-containing protein [Sphingomonadales bacterium]|nr:TIR domain-containing protein [Sphingomonadales bacterium]
MDSGDNTATDARPLLFVSYSRGDLDRARPVIDLLDAAGFDVWWDGRLEGGENFLQTTETALETAACVVVLWSATSVASHWVRDEAQRGRERGCLVPLTIDGTMAPLGFRQFQLLDISGWDGKPASPEAARILVAVRAKLGGDQTPAGAPLAAAASVAPARPALALSRRGMLAGGAGVAVAAGGLGAWQFGLLGSPASAAISMVVMPFANETGDPDKKYFSDGLARELRAVLARNPRLRVAAPTSSSAIAGEDDFAIGRKLDVGHILRGSVQRDNARVRVSAELVATDNGELRWAKSYDRTLEDVFAVQSEIAETVAVSLVAEVATEGEAKEAAAEQKEIGGTSSVPAYEAFLRGVALYDVASGPETDRAALAQFDAAIGVDANYAAAHAMRSIMLATIANDAVSGSDESRKLFDQAKVAAERSLALESRLARAHLALGVVFNNGFLKPAAAAPHYRAAQDLAPGDGDLLRSVASFLAYGEERAQAAQLIARVLELDPLNAGAFRAAGYVALFSRDYPTMITHMERALVLNPGIASAHFGIAVGRLLQGDPAGALTAAAAEPGRAYGLTATAIASARMGDRPGSDAAFALLQQEFPDSRYQLAQVHAQRGETAAALAMIESAFAVIDPGLLWLRNDPLLDPLRGEAGFKDLLSRLGS